MQIADIRIDEIVNVDGLPCHALGRAFFDNGRAYRFELNFGPRCGNYRVAVWRDDIPGTAINRTSHAARAIHDRLRFTDIAKREREAIAAFEEERLAACRALMRPAGS